MTRNEPNPPPTRPMSAAATRKPCISFRWPLIGLLLLIAATSGFLGLEASREATQPLPVTQVAASHASLPSGTIDRNGVRYRPIQTYQPCDRALGKNPELTAIDRANFGPEPDPATWKLLTLLAPKIDGSTADVSIVQPPEWLAEHNPQIGSTVPIWVPECGIDGNARVLSIAPCPPVKPGTGPVVLATFRHHVASTVDIHVTGLDQPIGCTGNHPFWSEDRQAFIRADELRQGEHLSSIAQTAYVDHIEIDPTPQFVYNLMVQGEHVYHVSQAGVLVHNGGTTPDHRYIQGLIGALVKNMSANDAARTTYAAARVRLADGTIETWVSAAGREGRVPVYLRYGDRVVPASGRVADQALEKIRDAERHILRKARREGAEILAIGATRPMCPNCVNALKKQGLFHTIATRIKRVKRIKCP